jgi:hypothetical protein
MRLDIIFRTLPAGRLCQPGDSASEAKVSSLPRQKRRRNVHMRSSCFDKGRQGRGGALHSHMCAL